MQLPATPHLDSWHNSNMVTPANRSNENLIITYILLPIALFVTGLRVFARTRYSHYWGTDDTLMVLSLVFTTAYSMICVTSISKIGWRHIWDLPEENLRRGLQMILTTQILFIAASALVKISILMFIRRLLKNTQVLMKYFIMTAAAAIIVQAVIFTGLELFQCSKISEYWSIYTQTHQCQQEPHLVLAAGIANTATTPVIFTFCLLAHHRTTMIVLFVTGVFVVLAGSARTYYLVNAVESIDRLWDIYPAMVAGTIELFAAIIFASFPPLQYLFNSPIAQSELEPLVNQPETKDQAPFMLKPTIYREVYREQHPEMHTPHTSCTSVDERSLIQPPSPTLPPSLTHQGHHLIHYLQSFSEDSQLLSPILEESLVSRFSTQSARTRRYNPSHHSSISSFNVAPASSSVVVAPSTCYTRPESISTTQFSYPPPQTVPSTNTSDNNLMSREAESNSESSYDNYDRSIQIDDTKKTLGPPVSAFGQYETIGSLDMSQIHQLSLFEFERTSDWNRDRESRISGWSGLDRGYPSESNSHSNVSTKCSAEDDSSRNI